MKLLSVGLVGLAVYGCLNVGSLGLLVGLGGAVLAVALGLALWGCK